MSKDRAEFSEGSAVAIAGEAHDVIVWKAEWELAKYEHAAELLADAGFSADTIADMSGDEQCEALRFLGVEPDEVIRREGNLLMYGGVSCLWECLIGNGTGTAGQSLTFFNNGNAAVGVGDSNTAAAATQTDLQASTNKLRKAMDATYPTHTDGVVVGAASTVFRASFATGDANWAWQEWGVFNSASAGTGRMLNRKVESLGTKTSAASWQFTVTLSLA